MDIQTSEVDRKPTCGRIGKNINTCYLSHVRLKTKSWIVSRYFGALVVVARKVEAIYVDMVNNNVSNCDAAYQSVITSYIVLQQ